VYVSRAFGIPCKRVTVAPPTCVRWPSCDVCGCLFAVSHAHESLHPLACCPWPCRPVSGYVFCSVPLSQALYFLAFFSWPNPPGSVQDIFCSVPCTRVTLAPCFCPRPCDPVCGDVFCCLPLSLCTLLPSFFGLASCPVYRRLLAVSMQLSPFSSLLCFVAMAKPPNVRLSFLQCPMHTSHFTPLLVALGPAARCAAMFFAVSHAA
jgi:hypothetical protein